MEASTRADAPRPARYREIEDYLRALVARSHSGDALPTEAELCDHFSVSRMTARQALSSLVSDGLVERRRGRGTFVAQRQLHRRPGLLLSFSEEIRRRGMTPSSRVIEAGRGTASADDATALDVAVGSEIVRIVRVRYADDIAVGIEDSALHPRVAGVLDADLETGSLHAAIARLGVQPDWQEGGLSARLARPSEVRLLGLHHPAAILVEHGIAYDTTDRPFERTETAYAGDRYVVDTIHKRATPLTPDDAA